MSEIGIEKSILAKKITKAQAWIVKSTEWSTNYILKISLECVSKIEFFRWRIYVQT